MNDSNTAAELRNDLDQMKRDKQAETMRPLTYDRAMEILTRAYAKGDKHASEVLGESMDHGDYAAIATHISCLQSAKSEAEKDIYYRDTGKLIIDNIVDYMIESAVKQAEEELL